MTRGPFPSAWQAGIDGSRADRRAERLAFEEYQKLAEERIAKQARLLLALRRAIAPFADISLARDTDETAPDRIEGPDLAITPDQVRAARLAHDDS
jgi:hypothetical protein